MDGKPPAVSTCCAQMVLQARHDDNAAAQISGAAADLVSVSPGDKSGSPIVLSMTDVEIQEFQPVTDHGSTDSAMQTNQAVISAVVNARISQKIITMVSMLSRFLVWTIRAGF